MCVCVVAQEAAVCARTTRAPASRQRARMSASSTGDVQSRLAALEQSILGTVETLDRLDEFTLPSLDPNNAGLAVHLCARKRLCSTSP